MSYQLRVPGPTPVPQRVLDAMNVPMINHRGPAFAELIGEVREGLKWAFQTTGEVVLFPSSGTDQTTVTWPSVKPPLISYSPNSSVTWPVSFVPD